VSRSAPRVALVDYGVGNIFSVRRALERCALEVNVTSRPADLREADAIVLPGVGSFGYAMQTLRALGLVEPLRECARSDRPIVGICLGLQLFLARSFEFGEHEGLGLIEGEVRPLEPGLADFKVPRVGWSRIVPAGAGERPWAGSLLEQVPARAYMYFVHSFHAVPRDPGVVLAWARHGVQTYCAALQQRNLFACQFHPERSAEPGLNIYRALADRLRKGG
jgi:imidazole glycerol-phosphate synthase subunit HisH